MCEAKRKQVGSGEKVWMDINDRLVFVRRSSQSGTLVYLDCLWEDDCVMLKRKQGLVQDIQCLHVCRCSELEQMPSMETMGYLEVLRKEGCVKLKSIHGLMHLKIFNL